MNRLAGETSPYLLQHAGNPVDWYPWGEEALEQARSRDVPILLSIGYAACHWCHVMEHESFEDAAVAEVMNRLFVNVKVDREERPDLDGIYMNAVIQFTGGHGGWPMTVFLLPTGEPFYGGTYYPPQPRMGLPGFGQLLEAVSEAYHQRRDEVGELAGRMAAHLREVSAPAPSSDPLAETVLSDAVQAMGRVFDPEWGGFGRAPKFPSASAIEFLLRMHRRDGDAVALEMATATLDGMALGGMYDLLGGGFARYSVDERWLVPHFEKMLYDNAQLAAAYLHAWVVTGRSHYREVCERTLDFVIRDLGLQEGVFASALDADTDGVEGTTYVWTPDEIRAALGSADAETAIAYYGVELPGNFEGASVLRVQGPAPDNLERIRARLHEVRAQRPQPARDDKAIACWNGLAVSALAEAGWRLDRPDLLDAAVGCAEFLLREMSDGDGRLLRSYRAGRAQIPGYLEDYGAVALGLLDLHTATGDPRWLAEAERLMTLVLAQFSDDQQGGFFTTAADGERLVARLKQLDDSPTPSGQSLAATALLKLARIRGRDEWEQRAVSVLRLALPHMRSSPHGLGQTLSALDIHLSPPQEIVVVGEPGDPATAALRHAARAGFRPNAVYAFADGSSPAQLPLLEGKGLVDGGPAVYICERFTCRAPLTDPAEVEAALR